jgi:hypothetical protein
MFLLICGTYTLNDNDIYDDYKNNKGIGMWKGDSLRGDK